MPSWLFICLLVKSCIGIFRRKLDFMSIDRPKAWLFGVGDRCPGEFRGVALGDFVLRGFFGGAIDQAITNHAAQQQGITTQADFDQWFATNRLNDSEYFLPALLQGLEAIVGDGWLFDVAVFRQKN
jgi:hypothetical protein